MESGGGSSVASSACFSPFSISLKLALFAPFSDAVSLSLRLLCGHDGSLDHSTRPRPESASAERATAKRERATSDARILRGLKRELLPINRSLASLFSSHPHHQAKPFMDKAYLSVFVNAMIENPAFDSQTKETLTLRPSSFGSKCDLPEKFMKQVADAGVAERVLSFATFKQDRALKKTDGAKRARIVGLPKLMDANDAGGRHSEDCTLILTEGDSAKSLVVGGLSVAGRDRFGVFPLRGKLLNVRDASAAAVAGNAEIQNIKQILGLQHGKVYENAKALRYGHLMIMTDQDHDGSHIKVSCWGVFFFFEKEEEEEARSPKRKKLQNHNRA